MAATYIGQTALLRLNATKIKSTLINSNKTISKLKVERIKLIDKASELSIRKKREKVIESPIKGIRPILGGLGNKLVGMARPIKDTFLNVFGLLLLGFAVDKLPKIIETLTVAFNKIKPIWDGAVSTLGSLFSGIIKLKPFADAVLRFIPNINLNNQEKELKKVDSELQKDLDDFDSIFGEVEEPKEEKQQGGNLFSEIGNFFTNLFKGNQSQTQQKSTPVKPTPTKQSYNWTQIAEEYKYLLEDYRNQVLKQKGKPAPAPTPAPQRTSRTTPAPSSSGATGGTREQRAMLATISDAEGTTSSYGTIYGGKVVPELAQGKLTIGQVLEMQRTGMLNGRRVGYVSDKHNSDATGKYQFMSYVLEEEMQLQNLSPDTLFTPAMQDKMILGRIARMRGVTARMLAREGMSDNVIDRLAPEFASFPNLLPANTGAGHSPERYGYGKSYWGQGGKSAAHIRATYKRALGSIVTPIKQNTPIPQSNRSSGGVNTVILPFGFEKLIPLTQAPTPAQVNSSGSRNRFQRSRGRNLP